ncbi:YrdB family protein [Neobacillus bataviensis]|uniref:YrdB family protein n=1 Tax=Neobacillus bataviensis TaxID=220685 RepID=UPI001CBFFA04|nr:YrdB family protein [Neobacillus bataviensis]
MEALKDINLGIRFLLEIMVLVILGYWGFHVSQGTIIKILLGFGTPLLAAVIWGMFGAPKAPFTLSGFSFLVLEIIIFGLPAVALFFAEKQTLAFIYGLIVVVNLVLMKIWHQ